MYEDDYADVVIDEVTELETINGEEYLYDEFEFANSRYYDSYQESLNY